MLSLARPHRPRQRPKGLAGGAGLAFVLLLLTGCSSAGPTAPTEVVLAVTESAAQGQTSLDSPAGPVVRDAIGTDHGHLAVLLGDGARVTPVLDQDLVLRRGAEVEHDPQRRERLTGEVLAQVDGTLRTLRATSPRLDLLSPLTEVGRLPGPRTVLVASSGLQTAAPLDLSTLGWEFDPARVADDLAARGYLPDLAGKDVTFVGLGQVTGAQATLPTPLRTRLEQLWDGVCRRAGGACRIDRQPLAAIPPATNVPAVLVPVPAVEQLDPGTTALPTALLFAPETATLLPGADEALAPLVAALANPARTVGLVGHTASVGPADGARALSLARARAIADALLRLGVRPTQITGVTGVGFDDPVAPDRDPAGALDPEAAAANRTVVATVSGGV